MDAFQKKVLVIEDEKALAKALELKLASSGFKVDVCFNGKEGVEKISVLEFDIILCDLMMPEMDGFAFLAKIKEMGIKTPVIVLTNLSQSEDFEKAKNLGAADFFVKADTPLSEIVNKVKKILNL